MSLNLVRLMFSSYSIELTPGWQEYDTTGTEFFSINKSYRENGNFFFVNYLCSESGKCCVLLIFTW